MIFIGLEGLVIAAVSRKFLTWVKILTKRHIWSENGLKFLQNQKFEKLAKIPKIRRFWRYCITTPIFFIKTRTFKQQAFLEP